MADKKAASQNAGSDAPGGKKKLIIILVAVIVFFILVAAGAGAFFILSKKQAPAENNDPGQNVPVPELNRGSQIGPMINIDEFIVNILSGEGNHYVKASLTLEVTSEMTGQEVQSRMPQVRDSILLLVGNKTYDELQDLQGKKQLKAELMSKLNGILQTGSITSIYFTDFVVQ